ncbi:MAG TPA: AarF/UbiB family protein [Thermomicrobiales bacterium]|jgi:predicted unusual protein kinase regulating ubiquinone biosynthesis (AarF/ABC1/UbiB family)/nucleotide-binding universal stress UspA family protein
MSAMSTTTTGTPGRTRVMVATDRSQTADRAVRWAANLANTSEAELVLLRVLPPAAVDGEKSSPTADGTEEARADLARFAAELAGGRGRAIVVRGEDPAYAIADAAEAERVDVLVVGNLGMQGRKQFLLGNIPNRVSHLARCTVVIVNTGFAGGAEPPQRPTLPGSAAPVEGELLKRAWRIGRVMAGAGAREMMGRSRPAGEEATQAAARRFRDALDQLGPTFAKLGQILSTRPDLLPPSFLEELATLQERVTPLTEAEVVAAMERELGVPWEDVFGSIDPTPLAAGTIAQVHRATLESGDRVVVKVQRPNAEKDILQDLGLLELFGQKAAQRPALRRVFDIPAMILHLSTSLRRELDFRSEAANMKRMAEVLAPFPRLGVPKVYEEYSTARLLVMEEIQGGSVREAPPGPARTEAARQLLEAYYHQVMGAGFFHADPHPGNMKWWNDRIYFLDLGMVGELDAETREQLLLLLLAFSQKDAPFLAEVVLALGSSETGSGRIDTAAFEADLAGLIDRYRDLSLKEIQLGPILQEVTEISVRHNVRVPASLMLTGKAFSQMQMVAAELDPTLDPFAVAQSFVLRKTVREIAGGLSPEKVFYEAQKTRARLFRVLEGIEGVVGARPGMPLRVEFGGTERLEETISAASRRLSLSLGLGGALVGAAMTARSERAGRWLPAVMSGIGGVLAARLAAEGVKKGRGRG